MDKIVFGSLFILVGCFGLLAVLFPGLRPSSVRSGTGTIAGFAMFFGGLGAATLSSALLLASSWIIFFVIFSVFGWILIFISFRRINVSNREIPDPKITDSHQKTRSMSPRLIGLIITIFLGDFFYLQAREAWTNYWLLKDGEQGMALVTSELWSGHDAVRYIYTVNEKDYTGKSGRNWQDEKYKNTQVGEKSVVYFSSSHPWLSQLNRPRGVVEGLPVIIVALFLEFFAIATIINPRGKWAYSLNGEQQKPNST